MKLIKEQMIDNLIIKRYESNKLQDKEDVIEFFDFIRNNTNIKIETIIFDDNEISSDVGNDSMQFSGDESKDTLLKYLTSKNIDSASLIAYYHEKNLSIGISIQNLTIGICASVEDNIDFISLEKELNEKY